MDNVCSGGGIFSLPFYACNHKNKGRGNSCNEWGERGRGRAGNGKQHRIHSASLYYGMGVDADELDRCAKYGNHRREHRNSNVVQGHQVGAREGIWSGKNNGGRSRKRSESGREIGKTGKRPPKSASWVGRWWTCGIWG